MYLSRKWWYLGIALVIMAVSAACAPGAERAAPEGKAPAQDAKLKPQYGGTFIMRAGGQELPSFDPRQTGVSGQYYHVHAMVYSGLMRFPFNQAATAAPLECDLCERWEQTNDTTYVFYLRKGVKWHNKPPLNGRELTAEDIRWALTDGEGYNSKSPKFAGGYRNLARKYGAKVESVDKYTVKITTKEPAAPFLMDLASTEYTYPPKESMEASKSDKNPEGFMGLGVTDVHYAIGTGPFMLKEYVQGISATLVRNPDYFRKDEYGNQIPYLDEVKVLFIPDHKVRTNAMLGGRLHEGGVYLDDSDLAKLERAGNFATDVAYSGFGPWVEINAEKPPFNDVRVRRALHLIVDRFEVMAPGNMRASQVQRYVPSAWVPYGTPQEEVLKLPGYRPDKTQDFEEAKRLLKEAGLEGGFSFTLSATTGGKDVEHATVIQSQLKPFKIDAKLAPLDRATSTQRMLDGVYAVHVSPTIGAGPDPSGNLWNFHTTITKEKHRWSDPKLDALIEKQDRIFDPKERAKVLAQIYDILDDTVSGISLYRAPWYRAWDKKFHNLKAEPRAGGLMRWVEIVWMEK